MPKNMSEEAKLIKKINDSNILSQQKLTLKELIDKIKPIESHLTIAESRLSKILLKQLIEEISGSVDTNWWEIATDLLIKMFKKQGEQGKPIITLIDKLYPILQQKHCPYGEVELREITAEIVIIVCLLSETLTEPKKNFVAPNAYSLAQAHFSKHAWFRAIYAGKALVGFMMLLDNPEKPEYFLWRFMIAEPYHGRGFGSQAINKLVEYVKTRPEAKNLDLSCVPGEGSPEKFYLKLGFAHTGEKMGDELILRLSL